jgi:ribosomal protein S18 acetylase RimI-like enzyme
MGLPFMNAPGESITTRPVAPADSEFLASVYRSTREAELNALGLNPAQQRAFLDMQYKVRRSWYATAYPNAAESIILRGEEPAGAMITHHSSKELRLVDIALLPEHRNRGIGARLISDLIAEANAAERRVTLSVLQGSPAIRLYQRLGFRPQPSDDAVYLEMEYNDDRPTE